jgi:hypothetical protein
MCDCGNPATSYGRCVMCFPIAYKLGEIPSIQERIFLRQSEGYREYYEPPKDI